MRHLSCIRIYLSGLVDLLTYTYACSKSALEGFVRSLAVEYARSKTLVNCVSLGLLNPAIITPLRIIISVTCMDPERTPIGRWDHVTRLPLISFLISDENSYMTGATPCDGGWSAA